MQLTNTDPTPYVWTETVEDIPEKLTQGIAVIETQHQRERRRYQVNPTFELETIFETGSILGEMLRFNEASTDGITDQTGGLMNI